MWSEIKLVAWSELQRFWQSLSSTTRAEDRDYNKSKSNLDPWVNLHSFDKKQVRSPCLPRRLVMEGGTDGVSLCAVLKATVWSSHEERFALEDSLIMFKVSNAKIPQSGEVCMLKFLITDCMSQTVFVFHCWKAFIFLAFLAPDQQVKPPSAR